MITKIVGKFRDLELIYFDGEERLKDREGERQRRKELGEREREMKGRRRQYVYVCMDH